MRQYLILLLVLVFCAPLHAGDGDVILGLWSTDPGDEGGAAHVEITKEKGLYSGKIIWLAEPLYDKTEGPAWQGKPKVDKNNPEKTLQNKPIIGLVIVEGFTYAGKNKWSDGSIYDPNNGKTYHCTMKLDGKKLKVRGYIGVSLFGRTTVWTRVSEK